jgi:uncharacterized repeat protein (TIGR04076 family)
MDPPDLELTVSKTYGCLLLKPGAKWIYSGKEVFAEQGARLCAHALYRIHPQVEKLRASVTGAAAARPRMLSCMDQGCGAIFKVALLPAAPQPPTPEPGSPSRRLEHGVRATRMYPVASGPFMSRIPERIGQQIRARAERSQYEPGQTVLAEGVLGERFFIIDQGEAEVVKTNAADGAQTVLTVLGPGDCFGEMSLLTGQRTSAAVRSRDATVILALTPQELENLLALEPELHRVFSRLMADRLRATNINLEEKFGRGILGKLTMISVVDLVQTLSASRRTGTLVLTRGNQQARVHFHDGRPLYAAAGDIKGEQAFYAVAGWSDGDFYFKQTDETQDEEARLYRDTMGLLMEAMRKIDEATREGQANGTPEQTSGTDLGALSGS